MAPTVLGHEAAGVVEAVGAGVTSVAPGDKVVLTPIAVVQRVLLVRARRVRLLRQHRRRSSTGHVHRRAHAALAPRRAGAARRRPRRLRRVRDHARDGRDQGRRRHAARHRVRDRLRGADRRRRGAQHRARARGRDGARGRARAASASRSCRARGSRARRGSSCPIRSPTRRESATRFGATDVIDPTADDVVGARARSSPAASASTTRSTRSAPGRVIETCIWATRNGGTTVLVGAGGLDQTVDARAAGVLHADRAQAHGLPASAAATAAATSRACSRCGARAGSTSRA